MKGASRNASGLKIIFTDADTEKARSAASLLKAEAINSNTEAAKKRGLYFSCGKAAGSPASVR